MNLSTVSASLDLASGIRERLRKDLRYLAFYMSPLMENFSEDLGWLGATHGVSVESARLLRDELIATKFWVRDSSGLLKTNRSRLGLSDNGTEAMTISEFLTLVTQLLCHLSADGSCWAECHTVVTSKDVKREFLSQISIALKTFLDKSQTAKGETVMSWAHVSLDTLKVLPLEEENEPV